MAVPRTDDADGRMDEPTGPDDNATEPPDGKDAPMLSVVVITHDERERIGACLDSVFEACDPLDRFEVVLVDSRSTDGTVDVASEYPITILRLPEEPPPTPSAGRYVGTAATTGDIVLFVDGDMVLQDEWLPSACRTVRRRSALGGVDGHLADSIGGEPTFEDSPVETLSVGDSPIEESSAQPPSSERRSADALRGVALYDRTAIAAAGGFDPFLQSNEDIDLSYRVRASGYRLVRLPTVVASHPPRESGSERLRRWRYGYYHGRGQLVRKFLSRPCLLARQLYRTRLYVAAFGWLVLGAVLAGVDGRRGARRWLLGTGIGAAVASLARGPEWVADKALNSLPVFAGVALGAVGTRPSPEEYPLASVETVQVGSDWHLERSTCRSSTTE